MEEKNEHKQINRQESDDFKAYRIAWSSGAISNRIVTTSEFQKRIAQKPKDKE